MWKLEQEGTKPHFILDSNALKEVKFDLRARFGELLIEEIEESEAGWDPGGMVFMKSPVLDFPLDQTYTLKVIEQHLSLFLERVAAYKARGPRGTIYRYYKLHGHWTVVVMNEDQFNNLVKQIETNPDLRAQGEKAFLSLLFDLEKLNEHPNISVPRLEKVELDS